MVIVVDEKVNFNLDNVYKRMSLKHNGSIYVKVQMKYRLKKKNGKKNNFFSFLLLSLTGKKILTHYVDKDVTLEKSIT